MINGTETIHSLIEAANLVFDAAKSAHTAAYIAAEATEVAAYETANIARQNALRTATENRQADTTAADKVLDAAKAAFVVANKAALTRPRMR